MAESTQRTVIIKLNFDVNDFTKQAVTLNREIEEINKNQKALTKSGQQGSVEFQKNKEKLTALKDELRQTNKVIHDLTVANRSAAGSNEQLRAKLSVLTLEYNGLSKEERETTARGKELQAQVKAISDELKSSESSIGDNRRNVVNYSDAIKELKQELKDARGELAFIAKQFGDDSPQYIAAAKRAGEINDRIQDLNQSIKASTGEPLERLGGDVALLKDKVLSLDFKGISTQLNSLGETIRGISFKSLMQGTDGLGSSFKKLATAILTNPIFILAGVVTAVVLAIKEYSDTMEQRAIKATERLSSVIETNIQYQNDLIDITKRNNDFQIELARVQNKREEDIFKLRRQTLDDDLRLRLDAQDEFNKSIDKLNAQFEKISDEETQKKIQEQINDLFEQKEENKKIIRNYNNEIRILEAEQIKFQKEQARQLRDLETNNIKDNSQRQRKLLQDKLADDIENQKGNQEAIKQLKIKYNRDIAELDKSLLRQLEDQQIESIQNEQNRAFAKLALENERRIKDINDSLASQKLKNEALKQNQILFEKEISDFNKAQAEKRVKDLLDANQQELKIESDFDNLKKHALERELNNRKTTEERRVEIVNAANELILNVLSREFEAKQKLIDFEIEKINKKKELDEVDVENLKNLNAQKDLLNAEYQQKQVDQEKQTQAQIDQIHKDALQKKAEQINTQVEISRIFLSSLNDLMFIFSSNQEKNADFAKTLALFQIVLDTATAISGIVSSSTQGDPYTYALRVATGIGTVISGIAKAKALLDKDTPSGPQIQRFAEGGQVLSGKKVGSGDGRIIRMPNGDNRLATVKVGEVVLNENQQAMLGGPETFRRIGVPGFAGGGLVDGGTFANSLSSSVSDNINAMNQAIQIARSLPPPIVLVQDINDAQGVFVNVESKANI